MMAAFNNASTPSGFNPPPPCAEVMDFGGPQDCSGSARDLDLSLEEQAALGQTNSLQGLPTYRDFLKKKEKFHPPPSSKKSKNLLAHIRKLGYSNFEQLPFHYWEPRLPNEDKTTYKSRRASEGIRIANFIKQRNNQTGETFLDSSSGSEDTEPLTINQQSKPKAKPVQHELTLRLCSDSDEEDPGMHPDHSPATSVTQATLPHPESEQKSQKRPRSPTETDHLPRKGVTGPHSFQKLQAELEAVKTTNRKLTAQLQTEIAARKKAEEEIITLRLVQQRCSHLEKRVTELEGGQPRHSDSIPQTLTGEIQKLIENILSPIIQSLSSSTTQKPNAGPTPAFKKFKIPGNSATTVKKTKNGSKTPNSSCSSTSQVVGNGPANTHIHKQLSATTSQHPNGSSPNMNSSAILPSANMDTDSSTVSPSSRSGEPQSYAETAGSFQPTRKQRLQEQKKAKLAAKTAKPIKSKPEASKRQKLPISMKEDPKTILLLPSKEAPIVVQKLQNSPEADPRKLGIRRHVQFPSGAALVTCSSENQANELRNIATQLGLTEKTRTRRPPQFTLHGLHARSTAEQVTADIEARFHISPVKVEIFPSKLSSEKFFAVVTTTEELLYKLRKVRTIRIGWDYCRVDTRQHIHRCTSCNLLGHTNKKCPRMATEDSTSSAVIVSPTATNDNCVDCAHYNQQRTSATCSTSGRPPKLRPTNHTTGSKSCPTLLAFKKKALPSKGHHSPHHHSHDEAAIC